MRFTLLSFLLLFTVSVQAQLPSFEGKTLKSGFAELDQNFTDYQLYELDIVQIDQFAKAEGGTRQLLLQLGQEFAWELEILPHDVRAHNFVLREKTETGDNFFPKGGNITYQGTLKDDPDSQVRLTIDEDFFFGYVRSGKKTWYIEPLNYFNKQAPANQLLVYEANNVIPHEGNSCAMLETHKHQAEMSLPDTDKTLVDLCYTVQLALMADGFMFDHYGSTPAIGNRLIGIINNVNGLFFDIFDDDIVFEVSEMYIITTPSLDPWPPAMDATELFNSFVGWAPGGFLFPNDLAQLWSHRNFPLTEWGISVQDGACSEPPNGYSLCMDYYFDAFSLARQASHVLGHNFGATDDPPGSVSIMSPDFANLSNDWSAQSLAEINAFLPGIDCLPFCTDNPEVPNFTSNITTLCQGSMVTFYDQSLGEPFAWSWSFPGGTPSTSTNPNPTVTYNSLGSYSVTLNITSTSGTTSITMPNYITVVAGGGSDFFYFQGFEAGLQGWTINNPDNDITWALGTVPSARQDNGQVMFVDNSAYDGFNNRDELISPEFDFTGRDVVSLEFDYAYAKRSLNNTDSLLIYISTDNGATYPDLIYIGAEAGLSGNFATRPFLPQTFFPLTSEDWCFDGTFGASCASIDLSAYAQTPKIRIKIENVANYGNTMYIDNIRLVSDCYVPVPPIADFSATPVDGCAPLLVQFINESQNIPTQYIWSFPGGIPASSTLPNPQVLYPGRRQLRRDTYRDQCRR